MKNRMDFFHSLGLNTKKKIEPCILWNLKEYPQTHIPLILQLQGEVLLSIEKKFKKMGCKDLLYLPIINGFYLLAPLSRIKELSDMPALTYLSMNHRVSSFMDRTGEKLGSYQINQYGITGRNVTIAHLDTGISPHEDFLRPRNRILFFKDFVNQRSSSYDDHGHGTHCAGCIAGNGVSSNGQYKGVAPDALLIGLKCLNEGGTGDTKTILEAFQWILENKDKYKIRIVHIPFGVNHSYPLQNDPLVKAVDRLYQEGLVVVCAAGNTGPQRVSIASPGTAANAITVGASLKDTKADRSHDICKFSSRGPTIEGLTKPDLVAPGRDVQSLYYNMKANSPSSYLSFSGTSISSSIVVGALALLLEKYPDFTPEEVKLALELSCNSLHLEKNIQGKGLLNIRKLLTEELI